MSTVPAAAPRSYAPNAEDLARSLPEIGDGLCAQLCELSARPTADGAETLAANLAGAHRAVLRLREALLCQGVGDGEQ
jgi:hypothetical protein